jgi:hypothetical protein
MPGQEFKFNLKRSFNRVEICRPIDRKAQGLSLHASVRTAVVASRTLNARNAWRSKRERQCSDEVDLAPAEINEELEVTTSMSPKPLC